MKNLIIIFLLLLVIATNNNHCRAQSLNKKYIIYTFKNGKNKYTWIANYDSIVSGKENYSRLFLEGFTKNSLDSCSICNNIVNTGFNPFSLYEYSSFSFSKKYLNNVDYLANIIDKKSIEIGKINKIYIYATVVSGVFCIIKKPNEWTDLYNYKGHIYIPISDFNILELRHKEIKSLYKNVYKVNYNAIQQIPINR